MDGGGGGGGVVDGGGDDGGDGGGTEVFAVGVGMLDVAVKRGVVLKIAELRLFC
jgi:hypothetical protein